MAPLAGRAVCASDESSSHDETAADAFEERDVHEVVEGLAGHDRLDEPGEAPKESLVTSGPLAP